MIVLNLRKGVKGQRCAAVHLDVSQHISLHRLILGENLLGAFLPRTHSLHQQKYLISVKIYLQATLLMSLALSHMKLLTRTAESRGKDQ